MIHYSTTFCCTHPDLSLSIFLYFLCFRNIYSSFSSVRNSSKTSPLLFRHSLKTPITMQAPVSEKEDVVTVASNLSKVHSLKAAIFHTMAYKLSLEINKNKITPKTLSLFSKFCTTSPKSRQKKITFEQYSRIHLDGPKIAICETTSKVVFVLNSSFTCKDQYFRAAIQEAITAFNNTLQYFG